MRGPILICFAVPEEAKFFKVQRGDDCQVHQVVTGMGKRNAVAEVRPLLEKLKPTLVITSGFAGALKEELKLGTVVFDADEAMGLKETLVKAGAVGTTFFCADRVAVTVEEKRALRHTTGADVVEMESTAIRAMCRERGIVSATVRVISDEAEEELPLDFNALMTAEEKIDFVKLAMNIARHPGKIPKLMRFQKRTVFAAQKLGATLEELVRLGVG